MKQKNENVEPFAVFQHADGFFRALNQLHQTSNPQAIDQIILPAIVLSAFASELFFKCLLCIETGKTAQIHLLLDLFKKLTPDTKKTIEKYWDLVVSERKDVLDRLDQSRGRTPRDLKSNLTAGSDGFRLVRYIYEGNQPPFFFGLSDLPIVLRNTIVEMRPDWFAQATPVVHEPHPVFVESEHGARNIWLSRKAVVDNESAAFQWAFRWVPIRTIVAPDSRRNNSSSLPEWFGSGITGITSAEPRWSLSLMTSGPFRGRHWHKGPVHGEMGWCPVFNPQCRKLNFALS
jgi:hypothetical protein